MHESRRPINVQLDPDALEITLASTSERSKGKWLSRLIMLAAALPSATISEAAGIVAEIEEMISQ